MVFLGRVLRKSWGFALALGLGCAGPVLATSDGTPPAEPPSSQLPSNCIGKVLATALHLERDLVAARRDVTERVRKSPNARAIADFILRSETPVAPILLSEKIPHIGQIRLTNDLRSGRSQVDWLDEQGALKQTLFDSMLFDSKVFTSHELRRQLKWGRIDSVRISPTHDRFIVRYRSYSTSDSKRFTEFQYPTGVAKPSATTDGGTHQLIRNYQEVDHVRAPDGDYYVRNYGLNASTDVVFIDEKDGTPSVVFSTLDERLNNTVQFGSLKLSPDSRYLAITTYEDGSQDYFRLKVFERATGTLLEELTTRSANPTWEHSRLSITTSDAQGHAASAVIDMKKPTRTVERTVEATPPERWASTVSKQDGTHVYLAQGASGDATELRIIDKETPAGRSLVKAKDGWFIDSAVPMAEEFAVTLRKGGERKVEIIGRGPETGKVVLESIPVPEEVSLYNFAWANDKTAIEFYAQSPVNVNIKVKFDRKTKTFDPPDFALQARTGDGIEYVSKIVQVTSRDGTLIPMRVTGRANMPNDGSHPVYMEVYGGFARTNPNFDPTYNSMHYEFLRRGGVLAAPAPRGGGELGEKWHQAGRALRKERTLEDIQAATRFLIEQKVTEPRKVILSGASNGGFVAAATALRYPDSYGLVIPTNGVLDFSRSETLDARVAGWRYEYGSNAVAEELANKERLSPVLQTANLENLKQAPEFLIVNGADDSRVNPAHSVNFYRALRKTHPAPSSVLLLSTENSGHFGYSPSTEKIIGWNTRALFWTRIFDFVGWKF